MGVSSRSLRILYVEEHLDTLAVTGRLLGGVGHVVVTATSCATARDRCKGDRFDLLITTMQLCDGDGMALLAQMRSHYPVSGIMLSGYGTESDRARSKEAGFDVHLTKPIEFSMLTGAIGDLLIAQEARRLLVNRVKRTE